MRTINSILMASALLLCIYCGPKKAEDSKEVAEEQNEDRFEKSSIEDDTEFAVDAADGGMLEVKLANVALNNASSQQVKDFAQAMIKDHSKANDELQSLATTKGISLPTALSDKCQKDLDDLSSKTGVEFDKAYANFMVKDHKNDIDAFKKEAEKGNDADLKAWAAGKIPVLEHHLTLAEELDKATASLK